MPDQKTSYKTLIVYQKAKKLTIEIINYFSKYRLPKAFEFIVNQLYRSASSVGANIAEGHGHHYEGSLKQFFAIASKRLKFRVRLLVRTLKGLK